MSHQQRGDTVINGSEQNKPEIVTTEFATPERAEQALNETWWRWAAGLVLLLTALLYFPRLGARALWASEFRWGEIAREMLLTHDYFWPTINGRVYFDKPLGSYWLVVAAAGLTGRVDEAATRIPCAIAGLLAVALLIILARRLYDLPTGVAAGFILATCFSFVFWARTASADVETVAGELAALLIFKNHEQRTGWWVVPLWVVMALTSLMKGLLGFVLPLLVIGAYSVCAGGWPEFKCGVFSGSLFSRLRWLIERNRWLFQSRTLVAVALAAIVYGAPFLISHARTGSARGIYMVYRENIERYIAPFDHRGPIYLYVYVIFGLMAPWSLFLPAALAEAHRIDISGQTARSERFVLVLFWATFAFFTLSGSRRSYYILPILPAAAIMIARLFLRPTEQLATFNSQLLKLGCGLLAASTLVSIVVLLPPALVLPKPWSFLPPAPHRGIFAACWLISVVALASAAVPSLFLRRYSPPPDNDPKTVRPRFSIVERLGPWASVLRRQSLSAHGRALLAIGVISYVLMFYIFVFAIPAGDRWRPEKPFAQSIRQLVDGHSGEVVAFKTTPPAFYMRLSTPLPQYENIASLISAVKSGRVRWVVLRQRDIPNIVFPAHVAARETTNPWDSAEHRRNALVLIEVQQR